MVDYVGASGEINFIGPLFYSIMLFKPIYYDFELLRSRFVSRGMLSMFGVHVILKSPEAVVC